MSANTAPESMADVTSEGLLASLRGAPAGDSPTREPEPAQDKPPADRAEDLAADGSRVRDERGRFTPKRSPLDALVEGTAPDTPATAPASLPASPAGGPQTPPAAPQQATAPTQAPPDLQARLAEAERLNQTLRGQVTNASRQAEERGKQAARQYYRDEVRREYHSLIQTGEATPEQVQQALGVKEAEWAQADEGLQRRAMGAQQVDLTLRQQANEVKELTFALYHTAAPTLAREHQLDPEHVRQIWADDAERERFDRAAHQAKAAENFPRAGFNASGLEDYLGTVNHFLGREEQLHKAYQAELAALRKQANRQDADDAGTFGGRGTGATTPRGGAPREKPPEHLGDITREHWLAAIRRNRARAG